MLGKAHPTVLFECMINMAKLFLLISIMPGIASPGPSTDHLQARTEVQRTTRSYSLGGTQLECFYLLP